MLKKTFRLVNRRRRVNAERNVFAKPWTTLKESNEQDAHDFEPLKVKPCEWNIMHIPALILHSDL